MRTWKCGAVLALALAVGACSGKSANNAAVKDTGSVNITISGPTLAAASGSGHALTSRRSSLTTSTTAPVVAKVTITYTGPDNVAHTQDITPNAFPSSTTIVGLYIGTYAFSAVAYDASGITLFSTDAPVSVPVQKSVTASVILVLKQRVGPGTVTGSSPFISSIVVSNGTPSSGETISLTATVSDPGASLAYRWSSQCSSTPYTPDVFGNSTNTSTTFTSFCTGTETITFTVTESGGGASTVCFQLSYSKNQQAGVAIQLISAPDILSITYDNGQPAYGATTTLHATAQNIDGNAFTYSWSDNCGGKFGTVTGTEAGSATASTMTTTWTAPSPSPTPQGTTECKLTLTVTDSVTTTSTNSGWVTLNVGTSVLFGSTVGGSVSGLASGGQLVLLDNGGDPLTISSSGSFTFSAPVAPNAPYAVTVSSAPASQNCTVSNGSGTMGTSNVTNVAVTCTNLPTYTLGGTVSGLAGTLVLQDNGGDDLTVSGNGSFQFATAIVQGHSYNVTVSSGPANQTCSVTNGSGSNVQANVTNVTVTCSTNSYFVGGTLTGLVTGIPVTLLDNGGDSLPVSSDGAFQFATKVAQGSGYDVTVGTNPVGQTCTVANGSGTMGGQDVGNVTVTCVNNYTVGGTLSGLATLLIDNTFQCPVFKASSGHPAVDDLADCSGGTNTNSPSSSSWAPLKDGNGNQITVQVYDCTQTGATTCTGGSATTTTVLPVYIYTPPCTCSPTGCTSCTVGTGAFTVGPATGLTVTLQDVLSGATAPTDSLTLSSSSTGLSLGPNSYDSSGGSFSFAHQLPLGQQYTVSASQSVPSKPSGANGSLIGQTCTSSSQITALTVGTGSNSGTTVQCLSGFGAPCSYPDGAFDPIECGLEFPYCHNQSQATGSRCTKKCGAYDHVNGTACPTQIVTTGNAGACINGGLLCRF